MDFLKRNFLGVLGTAVGILGIILSMYFYAASKQSREIAFITGPNHTVFSDSASFFDPGIKIISSKTGKEIDSNIYLNELTVWNKGNTSIRKTNILKPLKITYPQTTRIIGAFIIEQTRQDIVNATSSFTENSNTISISADILEPEDGFKIQIIYVNTTPQEAKLEGTIEGVKDFYTEKRITRENILFGFGKLALIIFLILAAFLMAALAMSGLEWIIKKLYPEKSKAIIEKLGNMVSYLWIIFLFTITIATIARLAYSFAENSAKESAPRMKTIRAELAPPNVTSPD